jgi:hypothetical protein
VIFAALLVMSNQWILGDCGCDIDIEREAVLKQKVHEKQMMEKIKAGKNLEMKMMKERGHVVDGSHGEDSEIVEYLSNL